MIRRLSRIFGPVVIPAVLVVLLGALAVSLAGSHADDDVHALRDELDRQLRWEYQLTRDNRRLNHLIDALATTSGLDLKVAREEANLIGPGDVLFQFPQSK